MPATSASDRYKTLNEQGADATAVFGVYMFHHPRHASEQDERTLLLCVGDNQWMRAQGVAGPDGVVSTHIEVQQFLTERVGLMHRELPEDFGLVCDEQGALTYRMFSNSRVYACEYLGKSGGPVSTDPTINVSEMRLNHHRVIDMNDLRQEYGYEPRATSPSSR